MPSCTHKGPQKILVKCWFFCTHVSRFELSLSPHLHTPDSTLYIHSTLLHFALYVNPSTPLVYPNRRFHKITTPDANTYCGSTPQLLTSPMSNKGTCSTPTPKCTQTPSFLSRRPHNRTGQQEPGQAHSHSPQTKKGSNSVALFQVP